MNPPPSPPPGFLGKDPLTMSECITRLYQQGTQVFDHFEALRQSLENEMVDWNSFLRGERLVASRTERSPAVNRVMSEMESRSIRVCGLIRNAKVVFRRLMGFHNDFLGILDTLKIEHGENILMKMEIERYKAMLQNLEKETDLTENPLSTSDENTLKKNASPEVEVIAPEIETIEISPESTQNEQQAPSCESLENPLVESKSRLILSPEVLEIIEESKKEVDPLNLVPSSTSEKQINSNVGISPKELSPEKVKQKIISPTPSINEDVLQLDLEDFNMEELEERNNPPKDAIEFATNFFIRDKEWEEILDDNERKEPSSSAISVLKEVLDTATEDLVNKIPDIDLSSDSGDTLFSEDFETVDTSSSDSSVSILRPLRKKKCEIDLSTIQPERIYSAIKTHLPVMIPLERIGPLTDVIDPRPRAARSGPLELAVPAFRPSPETHPLSPDENPPSTFRIPKKKASETDDKEKVERVSVKKRLGPIPDSENAGISRPSVRDRLGPRNPNLASCPLNGSASRPPTSVPEIRPLLSVPVAPPPRGILRPPTTQRSSPGKRIHFDDLLEAARLNPGTFQWKKEEDRFRVIYRALNGDSGSFTSDLIPMVQTPFFPAHVIKDIIHPRISICARLGKAFEAHQQWKRIVIDKNVLRLVVSSEALAFGIHIEELDKPFPQKVNLVRQQRIVCTEITSVVFVGNVGQKFNIDLGIVDRIKFPGFGKNLILLGQDFIREHAAGLDRAGRNDGNAVGRIVLKSSNEDRPYWSTTYKIPDDDEL